MLLADNSSRETGIKVTQQQEPRPQQKHFTSLIELAEAEMMDAVENEATAREQAGATADPVDATTNATANHHHIDPVLHPTQPMGAIIVIPAYWRWAAAG